MIINSSQYKQLGSAVKAASVVTLAKALGSKFPEERYGVADEVWIGGVARRVDRALKYGISDEGEVFQFLILDVRFGERFEDLPEYHGASAILRHRTLTGKRKLEKLGELLFSYATD